MTGKFAYIALLSVVCAFNTIRITDADSGPANLTPGSGPNASNNGVVSAGLSYQWTQPKGPKATISSDASASPTFAITQPGTYTFKVVVTPANSSSAPNRATQQPIGVIVFEPINEDSKVDSTDVNVGNGCSIWLQYAVGGIPQFGLTPPMFVPTERGKVRVVRYYQQKDLLADFRLARKLGATYAVVGTVSYSQPKCTLAYDIYSVNADGHGTKLATTSPPLTWTPGQDDLDAISLINAATFVVTAIANDGEIHPIPAPPATAPTQSELSLIPALSDAARQPTMPSDLSNKNHDQFAAVLRCVTLRKNADLADVNIAKGAQNTSAWDAIALASQNMHGMPSDFVTPPCCNMQIALAKLWSSQEIGDYKNLLRHYFGKSIDANIALCQAYERELLNSPSATIPQEIVSEWESSAKLALKNDPDSVYAELQLAKAATYASDYATANVAMLKALPPPADVDMYDWALQMYGEDGFSLRSKVLEVANQAAGDFSLSSDDLASLVNDVKDDPFGKSAFEVLRAAAAGPPPPTELKAELYNTHTTWINLTWRASVGAVKYIIYRGTSSGGEVIVGPTPGKCTTAIDAITDPPAGTYYYYLRAVDANGRVGVPSKEAPPVTVTTATKG